MDNSRFPPLPQRQLDMGAPSGTAALNGAPVAAPTEEARYRAKATEAAVKFESFFIGQMLHKMRESTRALADQDASHDSINSDMLDLADNLVADQLAGRRAFGVADAILRQLLPPPPAPSPPATNSPSEKTVFFEKKPSST